MCFSVFHCIALLWSKCLFLSSLWCTILSIHSDHIFVKEEPCLTKKRHIRPTLVKWELDISRCWCAETPSSLYFESSSSLYLASIPLTRTANDEKWSSPPPPTFRGTSIQSPNWAVLPIAKGTRMLSEENWRSLQCLATF